MLTPEQLALRMQGIGSSEIGAIAGLYPPTPTWSTAHDVYLRKRGLVDDKPPTLRTRIGEIVEELTAQLYVEQMGATLATSTSTTLVHPELAWVLATPDRMVTTGDRRGLEIKWVGHRVSDHWSLREEDGVPDYVRAQCEWQMLVTGCDRWDVAAILGGEEFGIWRLERHPAISERLLEIGRRFWFEHVVPGVPPAIDGSENARNMLEALFKQTRGEYIRATPIAERWIEHYLAAMSDIAAAKKRKAEAENALRNVIGENAGLESARGRAHCKVSGTNKRRTFRFFENKASKAERAACSGAVVDDDSEENAA